MKNWSMAQAGVLVFSAMLGWGSVQCLAGGEQEIGKQLRQVDERFLEGLNNHDLDLVKAVVSSNLAPNAGMLDGSILEHNIERAKKSGDPVKVSLDSFQYLGTAENLAFARVRLHAAGKRPAGRAVDSDVDAIHVFRHENGAWKLWVDFYLKLDDLTLAGQHGKDSSGDREPVVPVKP